MENQLCLKLYQELISRKVEVNYLIGIILLITAVANLEYNNII